MSSTPLRRTPSSFTQNKYRFVLKSSTFEGNRSISKALEKNVPWGHIKLVLYSPEEEYICPVCLDTPCAPKMSPCGHIFCSPCLIHWFGGEEASCCDKKKKCPMCNLEFYFESLHPVDICSIPQRTTGDICDFLLLKRKKGGVIPILSMDKNRDHLHAIPIYGRDEHSTFFQFLHFSPCDTRNGDFGGEYEYMQKEYFQLRRAFESTDPSQRLFLDVALERSMQQMNVVRDSMVDCSWNNRAPSWSGSKQTFNPSEENEDEEEEEHEEETFVSDSWEDLDTQKEPAAPIPNTIPIAKEKYDPSLYYFYQDVSGKKLFIDPKSMKKLTQKHRNYSTLPQHFHAKITKKEEHLVTFKTKTNKNSVAYHLPLGSTYELCTIEIA